MARHKLLPMQLSPRPTASAPRLKHILALDTSTERMALALQATGGPWQLLAEGGAKASATLLPQVAALLAQAGLAYADLDFIAFGRGPGAFTGLRTACAVAQGLAFALDKPVLPVDSLLIVAEDARAQWAALQPAGAPAAFDVAVAMDARMDEVYAARYLHDGSAWHTVQAPGLFSLPGLAEAWSACTADAVAGSALAAFGSRLQLPQGTRLLPDEHDRAAALLRLAVQAAEAGEGCDAAQALPLYLRDRVAQTTAEREADKAEKATRAASALAAAAATP